MARNNLDSQTVYEYVFKDQRGVDVKDPFYVTTKYLPYSKIEHYTDMAARMINGLPNPKNPEEVMQIHNKVKRLTFLETVTGVFNYSVAGEKVEDIPKFHDTLDSADMTELTIAFCNTAKLQEGQKKT